MKRLSTAVLLGTLLLWVGPPLAARYDCRMSGARGQTSCCCKGRSTADPCRVHPTSASCGCCDVTYQDIRLDAVSPDQTGGAPQASTWTDATSAAATALILPAFETTITSTRIRAPDAVRPPGQGDRHLLLCTFLC